MACFFQRIAVGQRFRDLQGTSTPPRRKRMSYHGILLPVNKEEPSGYKRRARCLHSREKNSPFCAVRSSSWLRVYVSPDRLSSIFFAFPHPSRVTLSTNDLKRRSSCIKDALRDALTFSRRFFSAALQLYGNTYIVHI